MGWSDAKIRKAAALLAACVLVFLVYAWLSGHQGTIPITAWSLAFMAIFVLVGLWRAFRRS